jgi:hypothetical protein
MPVSGLEIGPLPTAFRAQPGAVLTAQRRLRHGEHERVPHGRFEVDPVVDDAADLVLVRGGLGGRVGVGEQLREVDLDVLVCATAVPEASTPSTTDSSSRSSSISDPSGTTITPGKPSALFTGTLRRSSRLRPARRPSSRVSNTQGLRVSR